MAEPGSRRHRVDPSRSAARSVRVDAKKLLGRRPQTSRMPSNPLQPTLVTVQDPRRYPPLGLGFEGAGPIDGR